MPIRPWGILMLLAGSGLSGCIDQQKEVATYRNVLDEPAAVEPYDPAAPLPLARALQLANQCNERLAIQGELYLQALIDRDRAVGRFLPTLAFAPNYLRQTRTHLGGGFGGGGSLIDQFVPPSALDLPLEARVSTNVPGDLANLARANLTAEQQRQLLLDLKATVLLDVAQSYYQVLRSQRQVEVLEQSVAVQARRVADTKVKLQAGTARRLDVDQAQAQLSATKVLLIQSRNNARNGRAMLAYLIGVSEVTGPLSDELEVPPGVPGVESLLALAQENRADLQAAQARVEAARRTVEIAWAQYFPSVTLNLTYYTSRQSFPQDVNWVSLFEANVPIFSAGLIYANVRTAWSQLRQAVAAESQLCRQVLEQVREARENLTDSLERLRELRVEEQAASSSLTYAARAYQAGTGTSLEQLISQDQLLNAQFNLASEELNWKLYYLNLLRVVGELDTQPGRAGPTLWPAGWPPETTTASTSSPTTEPGRVPGRDK